MFLRYVVFGSNQVSTICKSTNRITDRYSVPVPIVADPNPDPHIILDPDPNHLSVFSYVPEILKTKWNKNQT